MTPESDHISLETMQGLCEGLLPEVEQCFVEDHLDECDDCRGVFRRMDALLYRGFSAEAHAEAIRREAWDTDPLVAALRRAASAVGREAGVTLQRWLGTASALWGSEDVPLFGTLGAVPVAGWDESEPVHVAMEAGHERCKVHLAELRRDIEVAVSGGSKPASALLFDPESDAPPVVALFETANGVHTARFVDIPYGQYLLAVSPF
jgi:hypothetical protein